MCPALNDRAAIDGARVSIDRSWGQAEQQTDQDIWASFCAECGACLDICPAANFGLNYDPRVIIFKMRYGLADKLLVEDSVVWECFQCHRCGEICPQPVKPVEMIGWLRQVLLDRVYGRSPGAARD